MVFIGIAALYQQEVDSISTDAVVLLGISSEHQPVLKFPPFSSPG